MNHLEKLKSLENAVQTTALPFEFGTDEDGGIELTIQLEQLSEAFEALRQDGMVDLADLKNPPNG